MIRSTERLCDQKLPWNRKLTPPSKSYYSSRRPKHIHFVSLFSDTGQFYPMLVHHNSVVITGLTSLCFIHTRPFDRDPELNYEHDSDEEWEVETEEGSDLDCEDKEDDEDDLTQASAHLRRDGYAQDDDFMASEDDDISASDATLQMGKVNKSKDTKDGRTRLVLEPVVYGPYLTEASECDYGTGAHLAKLSQYVCIPMTKFPRMELTEGFLLQTLSLAFLLYPPLLLQLALQHVAQLIHRYSRLQFLLPPLLTYYQSNEENHCVQKKLSASFVSSVSKLATTLPATIKVGAAVTNENGRKQ